MPYITQYRREELEFVEDSPEVAGELNYEFTQTIIRYLQERGLNYQTGNDVLGALDACAREFYDRVMRPYENSKIKINGDVYPKELITPDDS